MTIRDIKILSELIDKKIDLGLSLDQSILKEFENKTKHYNYLYANSINFIHEFFKFDNRFDNRISNHVFKLFSKNKLINKYVEDFANKGINF